MAMTDVTTALALAVAAIGDASAKIAEITALRADATLDPADQPAEVAETAAIRADKVTTAKAEIATAVGHLNGALGADWSDAPAAPAPEPTPEPVPEPPPAPPAPEPAPGG